MIVDKVFLGRRYCIASRTLTSGGLYEQVRDDCRSDNAPVSSPYARPILARSARDHRWQEVDQQEEDDDDGVAQSPDELDALAACFEVGGEGHFDVTDDQWYSLVALIAGVAASGELTRLALHGLQHRQVAGVAMLDRVAIFTELTRRNAVRREAKLPLLDIRGEFDHAVEVAAWREACVKHANDMARIRIEAIAESAPAPWR